MIQITLPDASRREYPQAVTVAEVAASIGAGLAKAALGGKVDGKVVDTGYLIEKDSSVSIITAKDADGLFDHAGQGMAWMELRPEEIQRQEQQREERQMDNKFEDPVPGTAHHLQHDPEQQRKPQHVRQQRP